MNGGEQRAAPGRGMRSSSVAFHQVLILLAAYFFGSGSCGNGSLEERVDDVVSGKHRNAAAVAIAAEIDAMVEEHLNVIVSLRNTIDATAERYDATPEELFAASEEGILAAEAIEAELLDARFRLHAQMRKKEWKDLFERSKPVDW